MKQLIEFTLENAEETVWVEVEAIEEKYGEQEVARDLVQKAKKSFQDALSVARPVAETIIGKLSNLSERPKEIEVEFGLNLSAEAGAIISSSGLEANFKVTLKWERDQAT